MRRAWRAAPARGRVRRVRTVDVLRRSVQRFFELEGFDRAMALAGQAFAALLPLLIVIAAVSPAGGADAASELIDRLDLSGDSAAVVREAVAQPAEVQDGISVLGFVILVISALAFTRALQRLYVRAWQLEKFGMRGNAWGLEWLGVVAVYLSLQPAIVGLFDGVLATAVSLACGAAMWLFTPWLLIGRRLPWQRLLPQALLTAVGLTALGIASALYMPRAVGSAAAQFGFIGVAFALLSWLFAVALILVVTASLGSTLGDPASGSAGAGDDAARAS
jgi:membrane protein